MKPSLSISAALVVLACTSESPTPCPGVRVATFRIETTPMLESFDCGFSPQSRSIRATLAWDSADPDEGAILCPEGTEALPLLGEHTGDHVTVSNRSEGVTLDACGSACSLSLEQTLEIDLVRDESGAVTGFAGLLRESLAALMGCETTICTLPCDVQYAVTGGL